MDHFLALRTGRARRTADFYLMSAQQGGAPVHVVLGLEHVHHLVGVELEHALHLHVLRVLLLPAIFGVLLLLFASALALPDPPQVPVRGGKTGPLRAERSATFGGGGRGVQ